MNHSLSVRGRHDGIRDPNRCLLGDEGTKETMAIVVVKRVCGADALCKRALQGAGAAHRTGNFFLPIDAIGVARQRMDAGVATEPASHGQQAFHIASALATAAQGDRRFAPAEQHAGCRKDLS
jgi:hypothetical protein